MTFHPLTAAESRALLSLTTADLAAFKALAAGGGGSPTPTPAPTQPVVLPAGSLYARNMLQGFGLNVPFAGSNSMLTAQLLGALGCRKVRMQLVRDNTGEMIGLQTALNAGGYSNPKLHLNCLLNGYIQDASNNQLSQQEPLLLKLAAAGNLEANQKRAAARTKRKGVQDA